VTRVTDDWLSGFTDGVREGDRENTLAIVHARATGHAGAANAADKTAAVRAMVATIPRAELPEWALWLAGRPEATAKEMGALLLARTYPEPADAATVLERLADDPNWEVREWAGSAAGDILSQHFEAFYPVVCAWTESTSQFVRRAVCLAVRGAADARRPERADALFMLVEALAADPAEEVKRNLGPFAVGGCLLARYPEETLRRVRAWAQSDDEMVRWNAAMVFVAANARKHAPEALELLSSLASDRRRPVWMAVASALKNLARRDPEHVVPELRRWLEDDRKLPAALALRHTRLPRD
jgi:HEAT repeat protein